MIVGDVNQTKVAKFIAEAEQEEGKELSFTIMTPSEFVYRQRVNDRFLALVLTSKIQVVIDKKQVLAAQEAPAKVSQKKKE